MYWILLVLSCFSESTIINSAESPLHARTTSAQVCNYELAFPESATSMCPTSHFQHDERSERAHLYPSTEHSSFPISLSSPVCPISSALTQFTSLFAGVYTPNLNRELTQLIPQLTLTDFAGLYKEIQYVDNGMQNYIYRATLLEGRNDNESNQKVALRVERIFGEPGKRFFPEGFATAIRLSHLRLLKVSDYIPVIYGVYEIPYTPDLNPTSFRTPPYLRVVEMKLLDVNYEKFFLREKNRPTPRIIIEELLGRWAIYRSGLDVSDPDGDVARHHMLKLVNNPLAYHIGTKHYLFPPGYSPRQVDFDSTYFSSEIPSTQDFERSLEYRHFARFYMDRLPDEDEPLRRLLQEIPGKGLLQSIYDNLEEFEISPSNSMPRIKTIHRYIAEEDLLS